MVPADLPPEIEPQLGALSDDEWSALTSKLRAPDSAEQLRTAAGKVLTGQALEGFMAVADVSRFVDATGAVSEEVVMGRLTAMFGVADEHSPRWQNFGQHQPAAPEPGPGDRGKMEARKRFGSPGADAQAPASSRGAAGRLEAERRFGKRRV